jgi:hypothetical protein
MPSFPATDDEWTAIITYFNEVSNTEAKRHAKMLDLVIKYVEAERAKVKDLPTPDKAWPGDDWYRRPEFAQAAQYLREWSLPQRSDNMRPIELDETKNSPLDLGKSYRRALYKARFTMRLYDSPYPFVEGGTPEQISDERYKLGEEFFMQMQCLSCHYLGDPNAPGAVKDPKAPNLSLTAERLQRRWVKHWVQEPPVIQPGTSMPAFFTGLPIFDLRGQTWSEATGRPKEEVEFFNKRYGNTPEKQMSLVLDYLYTAGARNVTAVQKPVDQLPRPPGAAATQPATGAAGGATTQPVSQTPAEAAGGAPAAPAPPQAAPATSPTTAPTSPTTAPTTGPVGLLWHAWPLQQGCKPVDSVEYAGAVYAGLGVQVGDC